ncbi:MAG: peptidase [Myxococcales bacterium]
MRDGGSAQLDAPVTSVAPATPAPRGWLRRRWRPLLRAMHRDMGYLVVGLTFVYAVSGIAVNHILDWDPSFVQVDARHDLPSVLPTDDDALARAVIAHVGRSEEPQDVFRIDDANVDIILEQATLHVNTDKGVVHEEGQRPRFILRVINWLHVARGKSAWVTVADAYAVLLLVLATSGMFMLAGRKGLLGRGGLLVAVGVAVPIVYVYWSGGP